MTHGDSPTSSARTPTPRVSRLAAAALTIAAATGAAGVLVGCDSSSGGQPFPEFEGTWIVDADTSSMNCPNAMGFGDKGNVAYSLWSSPRMVSGALLGRVTIEAGTVTDLVETSGSCLFGFDVMGKSATVPNPDRTTGMAPVCVIALQSGGVDTGESVVLSPSASQPLTFRLLQPVKGAAQGAQLLGAADATVTLVDNNTNRLSSLPPPCTFAAQVMLHKFAEP